ncbi:hypothetical protein BXZ70DRAFT_342448 [Cristinia sonorae]|uniref:Uncharacterized protein n=1 Tax=Cristinia sonorae TaxID=1940300 RepID=A0A8K0XN37_9AGAR|nr:hypothetical protein BXZ70DRAFT_342448 [Cristinia sonorae]
MPYQPPPMLERLRECFGEGWNFTRTFACGKPCPEAPNPVLRVKGVGVIALPLGDHDAGVIKTSGSARRLVGHTESVSKDETAQVSDIWEVDPNMLEFANGSLWDAFLAKTVKMVCKGLSVDEDSDELRLELNKLLVFGPGSCVPSYLETPKADDQFATVTVILPSQFTGGDVHFTHDDKSVVFDISSNSLTQTIVVASYMDAACEIKPITSGHRLALSYSLHLTTSDAKPMVIRDAEFLQEFRPILQSWKEVGAHEEPKRVLCRLDYRCSDVSAGLAALDSNAARLITMLNDVATEFGFHVALTTISATLTGYAYQHWSRHHGGVEPQGGEDWHEVQDRNVKVGKLIGLDGTVIAEKLEYAYCDTIPDSLGDDLEFEHHDEEDWYYDCGDSQVTRVYHHAAIVVWHPHGDFEIRNAGKKVSEICPNLLALSSEASREENLPLVEFILARASEDPDAVWKATSHVSLLWNDAALWTKAATTSVSETRSYRSLRAIVFDPEEIVKAVVKLGFKATTPGLAAIMTHDSVKTCHMKFLQCISQHISSFESAEDREAARLWISTQTEAAIGAFASNRSLRQSHNQQFALVEGLFQLQAHGKVQDLFNRLLVDTDYFRINTLQQLFARFRTLLVSEVGYDVLGPVIQKTIGVWIDKNLTADEGTPAPAQGTGALLWDCKCASCSKIRGFLLHDKRVPNTKTTLRKLTWNESHHLMAELNKHVPAGRIRVTSNAPTTVEVLILFTPVFAQAQVADFNRRMQTVVSRAGERKAVADALNALQQDDFGLQRLLGSEYVRIMSAVKGEPVAPPKQAAPVGGSRIPSGGKRVAEDHDEQPAAKRVNV